MVLGDSHAVQVEPLSLKRIRVTPEPVPSDQFSPSETVRLVVVAAPPLMTMPPVGGAVSSRM